MLNTYLNHFTQPDSIVPNLANPQALNRYSYALNNPIKYTDPSGHRPIIDEDENGNPIVDPDWPPRPKRNGNGDGGGGGDTISEKAFNGDLGALLDWVFPTHWGWRVQFEVTITPLEFLGIFWSPSGTLGLNVVYNRKSDMAASFIDLGFEPAAIGAGTPVGISATTGPLMGWASSDINDVISGDSAVFSGTGAAEGAVSLAISAPIDGDIIENPLATNLHVDPEYGQVPVTGFLGVGVGGGYAGAGLGASRAVYNTNLSMLLPWHWSD